MTSREMTRQTAVDQYDFLRYSCRADGKTKSIKYPRRRCPQFTQSCGKTSADSAPKPPKRPDLTENRGYENRPPVGSCSQPYSKDLGGLGHAAAVPCTVNCTASAIPTCSANSQTGVITLATAVAVCPAPSERRTYYLQVHARRVLQYTQYTTRYRSLLAFHLKCRAVSGSTAIQDGKGRFLVVLLPLPVLQTSTLELNQSDRFPHPLPSSKNNSLSM